MQLHEIQYIRARLSDMAKELHMPILNDAVEAIDSLTTDVLGITYDSENRLQKQADHFEALLAEANKKIAEYHLADAIREKKNG